MSSVNNPYSVLLNVTAILVGATGWSRANPGFYIPPGTVARLDFKVVASDYIANHATWVISDVAQRYKDSANAFVVGGSVRYSPKNATAGASSWDVRLTAEREYVYVEVYAPSAQVIDWLIAAQDPLILYGSSSLRDLSSLNQSLVSYWKLDETSDGSVPVTRADSLMVNDLTDTNTVASGIGIISSSASFVPLNLEYLSHPDNASLSMGAGVRMTLTCWVQLAGNSDYGEIVSKWSPNFEYRLLYDLSLNRFAFWVSSTGADSFSVTANSLGVPALNTWYFIACTYDGSNISIKVNNGAIDSTAFTADIVDSTSTFYISSKGGTSEFWNGLVGEVGLWKRVLSSADLTALYNGGLGLTYPFS